MDKTYSQKIALAFSIISSILLIPATFGLFFSMIFIIIGIQALSLGQEANFATFIFPSVILAIYILGVYLFVYHIKHYRGTVNSNKMNKIWIMTAIYNGIFSVSPIFTLIGLIVNFDNFNSLSNYKELLVYSPVYIWWILATVLPISAKMSLEKTEIK
jgi:hypothetical protein